MTVRELIARLGEFDPNLPVVYRCCSEYNTLSGDEIIVMKLHPARPDGWVHDFDKTQAKIDYVTFPGN